MKTITLYALVHVVDGQIKQSYEMYNDWFSGETPRYKPLIYDTRKKAERAIERIDNKQGAWLPENTVIMELKGQLE